MFAKRIPIPIDREIVAELLHRGGSKLDIGRMVDDVLEDFLERTAGEAMWTNPAYLRQLGQEDEAGFIEEFGQPDTGYRWGPVFLPNGTHIRMRYGGKDFFARVKHRSIFREDGTSNSSYSPSEFARYTANLTNRNAWRDLWIKRPRDRDWILADDLRRSLRS